MVRLHDQAMVATPGYQHHVENNPVCHVVLVCWFCGHTCSAICWTDTVRKAQRQMARSQILVASVDTK